MHAMFESSLSKQKIKALTLHTLANVPYQDMPAHISKPGKGMTGIFLGRKQKLSSRFAANTTSGPYSAATTPSQEITCLTIASTSSITKVKLSTVMTNATAPKKISALIPLAHTNQHLKSMASYAPPAFASNSDHLTCFTNSLNACLVRLSLHLRRSRQGGRHLHRSHPRHHARPCRQ